MQKTHPYYAIIYNMKHETNHFYCVSLNHFIPNVVCILWWASLINATNLINRISLSQINSYSNHGWVKL